MKTNMNYIIELKEIDLVDVVYIRRRIPMKDIGSLFDELSTRTQSADIQPIGPSRALYLSEEFDPEDTEIEVCFPVADKKEAEGISYRQMEGGTHAYTVHLGSYSGLSGAFAAVNQWIQENGYTITCAPFENYIICCDMAKGDENKLVTEVCFPVAKK